MRSITTRLSVFFLIYLCLILGGMLAGLAAIQIRSVESAGDAAATAASGFMREQWERQAGTLVELYAEQLVQPVYVMNLQAIRDLAAVVRRQGVVLSILVLDGEGKVLSDGVADSSAVGKAYDASMRVSSDSVLVREPIKVGGHVLGEVVAEFDPGAASQIGTSLERRVRGVLLPALAKNRVFLAGVCLAAILSGVAGAYILSRGLSRRITLVGDALDRLARYDYDIALPGNARDEIGSVAASLATLAVSLKHNTVSRQYMEAVIENMPMGVAVTDMSGRVLTANTSFNQLCGVENAVGEDFASTAGIDASTGGRLLGTIIRTGRVSGVEVNLSCAGKTLYAHLLGVRVASESSPSGGNLLFVLHDISERKDFERRLVHMATHDHLTGLANRRSILDAIERELILFRQGDAPAFWIVFIDLDGFKYINDSQGHAAGDEVLRTLAGRIAGISRETDMVGRMGGDEFLVLLRGSIPREKAIEIGRRFLASARDPVVLKDGPVVLSVSVGMARSSHRHTSADNIVEEADGAMYLAKHQGRDQLRVSGETDVEESEERGE